MAKENSRENRTQSEKVKKKAAAIMWLIAAFLMVIAALLVKLIIEFNRYEYVNGVFFPLWYVALGVGIVGGAIFTVTLSWKHFGIGGKICGFVFVALVLCYFTGVILGHLNHFLDKSEPKQYIAVIEDKDYYIGHRKSLGRYQFKLTVYEDSFYIEVPTSHYNKLDEGDLYVVEYHKGAFNEPYYIAIGEASE